MSDLPETLWIVDEAHTMPTADLEGLKAVSSYAGIMATTTEGMADTHTLTEADILAMMRTLGDKYPAPHGTRDNPHTLAPRGRYCIDCGWDSQG